MSYPYQIYPFQNFRHTYTPIQISQNSTQQKIEPQYSEYPSNNPLLYSNYFQPNFYYQNHPNSILPPPLPPQDPQSPSLIYENFNKTQYQPPQPSYYTNCPPYPNKPILTQSYPNLSNPVSEYQGQPTHYIHSNEEQTSSGSEKKTLWMGELDPWMDINYLRIIYERMRFQVEIKMMKDKLIPGKPAGFCFVGFLSNSDASRALNMLNGTIIPGTCKKFRLNWSSGNGLNDKKKDRPVEYPIFVGDLSLDVTDIMLLEVFQSKYKTVCFAKIVFDQKTGQSKGFGFVRFLDAEECEKSKIEMQGVICGLNPMKIGEVTSNDRRLSCTEGSKQVLINCPTLYVGGLDNNFKEEEIHNIFSKFGEIKSIKIPNNKGCAFVQYFNRICGDQAINHLDGFNALGGTLKVSWSRSSFTQATTLNKNNTQSISRDSGARHSYDSNSRYHPYAGRNSNLEGSNLRSSSFQDTSKDNGVTIQPPQYFDNQNCNDKAVKIETNPFKLQPYSLSRSNQSFIDSKNQSYLVFPLASSSAYIEQ